MRLPKVCPESPLAPPSVRVQGGGVARLMCAYELTQEDAAAAYADIMEAEPCIYLAADGMLVR